MPQGEKWDAPSNQTAKWLGWALVAFVILTLVVLAASGGDVFLPFVILSALSDSDGGSGGFSGGGGSFDGGGSSSDW